MPGVNVKGPKNGEFVKAKFVGSALKDRKDLNTASVILLISIKGNKYCTGDSFAASLQHAVKQYGNVTCLIVDTPHWHNLRAENTTSSDKELQESALKLGDEWWSNNENAFVDLLNHGNNNKADLLVKLSVKDISEKINTFNFLAKEKGINCNVLRWDDWLNLGNCHKKIQEAEEEYTTVAALVNGIEKTADEFAHRHDETKKEMSKNYLIKECPGIMIIGAERGYDFVAYPGDISSALMATHDRFVKPQKANKMQWLRINYKRFNDKPRNEDSKKEIEPTTKQEVKFLFGNEHNFFSKREDSQTPSSIFVSYSKSEDSQDPSSISVSYSKAEQLTCSNIIQTMSMLPPEQQNVYRQHLIDFLLNLCPDQKLTEVQPFQSNSNSEVLPQYKPPI